LTVSIENQTIVLCIDARLPADVPLRAARKIYSTALQTAVF